MRAIPREGLLLNASQASYLAGFLDGDGSIHFQLVKQKEYKFGFYIRASLSFSQSTSARFGLEHIQAWVRGGYLRDRGTGMSDLVITSRPLLIQLLNELDQFTVFKKEQVPKGSVAVATDRSQDEFRGIPQSCTRSGRVLLPKLFEDEADYRCRCRTPSAWQGKEGPCNDFLDRSSRRWDLTSNNDESRVP